MIPLHDDNPTRHFPFVTVAIIVACVLTFVWQISLPEPEQKRVVYALGVIPAVLFQERLLPDSVAMVRVELTLFTSMFLHGGWWHLAGNMLYLWIFGNNVEDRLGVPLFILFYVLCGIAAAFTQALPDSASVVPMIGASGAISGVLGAYLLLYPRARVLVAVPLGLIVTTWRLPALVVLGFWFVLQLANNVLVPQGQGGVAWGAHVGGFVAGMVLIVLLKGRYVRLFRTN
ncbi:MAG: rhomboid family intramembrane serine protease [Gammaproteobacteria bacterium]|nr:rhomboid family intramembrane serine protease [Gammaproteobacteria bacterium]